MLQTGFNAIKYDDLELVDVWFRVDFLTLFPLIITIISLKGTTPVEH